MFLTVEDGIILGPICWLFGKILEIIYRFIEIISNNFGIEYVNLSICIILFTIVIRGCLFPLNFRQQKSSKVMNLIQPEINKATKKYNNKTDQESMMKKNEITQSIQKKYGVSMTSGCLTSFIQLPIIWGLYRVIQNIPAYISDLKDKYVFIVNAMKSATFNSSALKDLELDSTASYYDVVNAIVSDDTGKVSTAVSAAQTMMDSVSDGKVSNNSVIDVLDKMSATDWNQLVNVFDFGSNADKVNSYIDQFQQMNQFLFGINISETPGFKLSVALIVPILSAVFQLISSKMSMNNSNNNSTDPAAAQTNGMMKTMMYGMPIFSFFICISLPVAIGIYWTIGALISIITQLIINSYYKRCDTDKLLEKCKEKAAKKAAKKEAKHPGKKSFYEKMMDAQNGNVNTEENQSGNINKMAGSRLKTYNNPTVDEIKRTENSTHYKEGSLGAKANLMLKYQNNGNDNGGKK